MSLRRFFIHQGGNTPPDYLYLLPVISIDRVPGSQSSYPVKNIQGRRGSFQDSMSQPSRLSSTLMRRRKDQLRCGVKPHSRAPTSFKACSSADCLCLERRSVKPVALISMKTTVPLASSPTTSKCRRPSEFASDFVRFFELRDLVACCHRAAGNECIDSLALTRI